MQDASLLTPALRMALHPPGSVVPPSPAELPASFDKLYMGASQREVAGALVRGLARPGATISVTGEAGLGKTTLVDAAVAARAGDAGLVRRVDGAAREIVPALQELCRTAAGTGGLLIIDGAHDLSPDALRCLSRLLLDDSLRQRPQVVLVARPHLWAKLNTPAFATLRDRIDVRAVLFPMGYAEAEGYVGHLFRLAGSSARTVLTDEALHALLLRGQGNLRQINAELTQLLRSGRGRHSATPDRAAAQPSLDAPPGKAQPRVIVSALLALALAGTAVLLPRGSPDIPIAPAGQPEPDDAAPVPQAAKAAGTQPPSTGGARTGAAANAELAGPLPSPASAAIEDLLRRGDAMMERRDVPAARLLYERAARAGSPRAAMSLGDTYGPAQPSATAADAEADRDAAAAWHRLSETLSHRQRSASGEAP